MFLHLSFLSFFPKTLIFSFVGNKFRLEQRCVLCDGGDDAVMEAAVDAVVEAVVVVVTL